MKDFAKQTVENERLSMFIVVPDEYCIEDILGNIVKLGLGILFLLEVCCIYNTAFLICRLQSIVIV